MPSGDSTLFLIPGVQYHMGVAPFSAQTRPSQRQVLDQINDAIRDMIEELRPKRQRPGEDTVGRKDKLTKITTVQAVAGTTGVAVLPMTGATSAPYITDVIIGAVGASFSGYPAQEIPLRDLQSIPTAHAPATTEPVYAIGAGQLYYLPTSLTAVQYHWLTMPLEMNAGGGAYEDFPLDDDLMVPAIYRAVGYLTMKSDPARSAFHLRMYDWIMALHTGNMQKFKRIWGD